MSNKRARQGLPELVHEVELGLDYLVWVGGNSQLQAAYLDEIRFKFPELASTQVGINFALNQLCYDLRELADLYWEHDSREKQLMAIIDEIQDFQRAIARSRK